MEATAVLMIAISTTDSEIEEGGMEAVEVAALETEEEEVALLMAAVGLGEGPLGARTLTCGTFPPCRIFIARGSLLSRTKTFSTC